MPTDKEIREKIISRGFESLSDGELVSLFIGDKTPEHATERAIDSVEYADRLLDHCGGLSAIGSMPVHELRMKQSLGIRRAVMLGAAAEIGRRIRLSGNDDKLIIRDKNDVVELFEPFMSQLHHEELWVMYLTSANRLIEKVRVSQGGVTSITVDSRIVIKRALELLSPSIILVHNHPSGAALPSGEDRIVTNKLKSAAALFDITLVDHIILSREGSYSFRNWPEF